MKRYALLSVSDKEGIVEFGSKLHEKGFEILSTGGTAKGLLEHGIPVTKVSDFTGHPEVMNGRVKTLHPIFLRAGVRAASRESRAALR